jgi:two-component system NarL family response regulator
VDGGIAVLLVDDDPVFRVGLRVLLEDSPGVRLIGEAAEGEIALRLCAELPVEVLLLDIGLPGAVGPQELVVTLKRQYPQMRILALTSHTDARSVTLLLEAGIDGYVVKGIPIEQLVQAVIEVHAGHSWWDGRVAAYLRERPESTALQTLTPRERQILQLLVQGLSNQQIARDLFISVGTVQVHVHAILRKLGVRDRTQAVIFALQQGL